MNSNTTSSIRILSRLYNSEVFPSSFFSCLNFFLNLIVILQKLIPLRIIYSLLYVEGNWYILKHIFTFVGKKLLHIIEQTFLIRDMKIVFHSIGYFYHFCVFHYSYIIILFAFFDLLAKLFKTIYITIILEFTAIPEF